MATIATSYLSFIPSTTSIWQQQVTLDNEVYTLTITWNLFGARYYITITDSTGTLIVYRPLIGSPLGYDLAAVTSANNIVVATTSTAHTYRPGSVITLNISGCTPDAYNGQYQCNILSNTQFSYSLVTTDTVATGLGQVNSYQSLTAGYFNTELVYFPDSQQLVVYG